MIFGKAFNGLSCDTFALSVESMHDKSSLFLVPLNMEYILLSLFLLVYLPR